MLSKPEGLPYENTITEPYGEALALRLLIESDYEARILFHNIYRNCNENEKREFQTQR